MGLKAQTKEERKGTLSSAASHPSVSDGLSTAFQTSLGANGRVTYSKVNTRSLLELAVNQNTIPEEKRTSFRQREEASTLGWS